MSSSTLVDLVEAVLISSLCWDNGSLTVGSVFEKTMEIAARNQGIDILVTLVSFG